jgi:hypothetical protein
MFNTSVPDDKQLFVIRRDFSGGANNRIHASKIGENQCDILENWDIGIISEARKCPGLTLVEDLGTTTGTGALGFEPRGGTNELLVTHSTKLEGWIGSSTFVEHKTNFTTGLLTTMVKATCSGANGDVVIVSNGTDNVYEMHQDHSMHDGLDDNYACPKTTVLTFFRNRMWALKANLLYWSDALPSSYVSDTSAHPFDRTTQVYNITVGAERAVIGLRDIGLICLGADAVYGINPTIAPVATDKPEKILDIGCVAGNTACLVGDDVYFLASDGVRGVFRSQQDKLTMGNTFPISYQLKDEFESINWTQILKACAVWFDNKYFLSLPVDSSLYNNEVWVYYPALKSWMVITDWNVSSWATITINGEERLYATDSTDGLVYRAWYGYSNNGTAITSTMDCREEDCGQPLIYKNGGELEIEGEVAGSGNSFSVSVAIDGRDYQSLGSVSLTSGTAPVLPVVLPFTLVDSFVVRKKFHLDDLGKWRTMQIQIVNSDNNTDPIVFYGYSLVTFVEEYQNE